jgi:hypothetical protein
LEKISPETVAALPSAGQRIGIEILRSRRNAQ